MAQIRSNGALSSGDRFGMTVFASILAHMLFILGVSFSLPELLPDLRSLPALDIVLVNMTSNEEPDEADFLAQANQDGGGTRDESVTARSPLPLKLLPTDAQNLPTTRPSSPQSAGPRPQEALLSSERQDNLHLVRRDTTLPPLPPTADPNRPGILSEHLTLDYRAQLSAEISEHWDEYQKRPRRKFLSARTREYRYAAYMEAWRAKVEQVGNRNYPEAARAQQLTGSLVLDVALNPDGSVDAVRVERPSPYKLLNDAAVRIVRMASPFAPFPEEIRENTDILHITHTWEFSHGARITAR